MLQLVLALLMAANPANGSLEPAGWQSSSFQATWQRKCNVAEGCMKAEGQQSSSANCCKSGMGQGQSSVGFLTQLEAQHSTASPPPDQHGSAAA